MSAFGQKVRRLEKIRLTLRRRYGEAPKLMVAHPVEHALRTILSEEATTSQVEQAMNRLREHFVDWNDLRVSRPREIREVLGPDFPRAVEKARVIPRLLDQVFKRHNSMVWDFLEDLGKVAVRSYFESLQEVRPFVAAILARDCAGAHAFPVDRDVARVLERLGILEPQQQSEREMQAMLERAVKQSRGYEAHWLLKRLAEDLCRAEARVCSQCPLRKFCPSVDLAPRRRARRPKRAAKPRKRKPAAKRKRSSRKPKRNRRTRASGANRRKARP
jgi:endonuclease III